MCCFRLHFSDFNVLFLQKNKKLEKITCREEKSQPPPPGYQMVRPLPADI